MIQPPLLLCELLDRLRDPTEAARGERFDLRALARRRSLERDGEGVRGAR